MQNVPYPLKFNFPEDDFFSKELLFTATKKQYLHIICTIFRLNELNAIQQKKRVS